MGAGKYRHRIDIERKVANGDGYTWQPVVRNLPAEIKPLSAREFVGAGSQVLGQASARIEIRYRPGLDPTMRVRHGAVIYNILGVLEDDESGTEWITLPVSRGTNAG